MLQSLKESMAARELTNEQTEIMMDLVHESDESDPLDDHIDVEGDDPEIEKALEKIPEDAGSIEELDDADYKDAEAVIVDMEELLDECTTQ